MNKFIYSYFSAIIVLVFFVAPVLFPASTFSKISTDGAKFESSFGFEWPIPGYVNISSYFGRRNSPTSGASSYHSGIDIPAPEGTPVVAIDEGVVYFTGWGAGGGYTISIQLTKNQYKLSYCHLSPIMFVSTNQKVIKGQVIGTVGPKNVYGIQNNPYKDSNGNPTNGATTGCHLHFTIKENNVAVDPFNYYD
jgi:murein DD-endopeptidase MepM/ murein hydrolase activator NlpD